LTILNVLWSLLTICIIGYAFALLIFRRARISGVTLFLLSIGLGFGILAEFCYLFLMFSRKIPFQSLYSLIAPSLILVLFMKRRAWGASWESLASQCWELARTFGKEPLPKRLLVLSAVVVVITIVAITSFNLVARPAYQFDSRAIWLQKAKILYHERTIFSDAVVDIARNHPHPRYPLLLPMTQSWVFYHMQETDDRAGRLLFLLFFVGLLAATYELSKTESTKRVAAFSLFLLLLVPFMYSGILPGTASGYADLILSFYITSSALMMALWLKERKLVFVLAGAFLAAACAMVKNEGLVFAGNLLILTAIFSLEKGWLARRKEGVLLFFVITGLLLAPALSVRSRLPAFLDENYLAHATPAAIIAGVSRVPKTFSGFIREFSDFSDWGVFWLLIGVAAVQCVMTRRRIPLFILALILVQVFAYFAIFIITPNDPAGQMRDALSRLFYHVSSLGAALVAFQLAPEKRMPPSSSQLRS